MSSNARQTRPSPCPQARGSAMLEKACYQYQQCVPARTCEPGCRKKKSIVSFLPVRLKLSPLALVSSCIFFGQLITRLRCMPGAGSVHYPPFAGLQHSTLALYKRARPCLPDFFLFTLLVEALLSASFASELPGAGERQNQKALPQPRTWKGMCEKIPPHELI